MRLLRYHEFRIIFDSDRKELGHRSQRRGTSEELMKGLNPEDVCRHGQLYSASSRLSDGTNSS